MAKKLLKVLYKTIVIVKKCHFGTMVGWVKGFDPLFETYYLSVIAYGRSQINISENPLPILQKNHFLTITLRNYLCCYASNIKF